MWEKSDYAREMPTLYGRKKTSTTSYHLPAPAAKFISAKSHVLQTFAFLKYLHSFDSNLENYMFACASHCINITRI